MKKNYKEMLNASFEAATPEMRDDVRHAGIVTAPEKATAASGNQKRRHGFSRKYVQALIAACMCVVVLVSAVLVNTFAPMPGIPTDYSSFITLEINPAFSITVDKNGNLDRVTADNYDAEVVLDSIAEDGIRLKIHYDKAIKVLISYAQALGYFSTSDGINIDIYNCMAGEDVCQEMQNHIFESISGVATGAPAVTIGKMAKEKFFSIAKEIKADISETLAGDKLYAVMRGKKSYRDTRPETGDCPVEDIVGVSSEVLYDFSLIYYSAKVLSDLEEEFEDIADYIEDREITAERLFAENGLFLQSKKIRIDALLAWMGDSRTLTYENYEALSAMVMAEELEDDFEKLEELMSAYRDGGAKPETLEGLAERLLGNEVLLACYEAVSVKYPYSESNGILSGLMALERSYRQATSGFGSFDWLFGGHGNRNEDGHRGNGGKNIEDLED